MAHFEPEVFGKYYLIDRIATGGMAEIFKAKSYSTAGFEKLQVIKRILAHLTDNEEFVDMFIDEAKISVSLQHANIVQIYDFGKIRENYFISMEWIDGKDVKQLLRKLAGRRKLLPEEFAVYIAHETCKGLYFAHEKTNLQGDNLQIVHRDMSPSNVLVGFEGEVKVADFGIAKAEMSQYTTKDGVLKGKFEYMSPEQAHGESVSQQSDLFSVGIVLYEMLTGRRLFKTESELMTLEKIKAVDIGPPSSVNPNISERMDKLVMRALTADINERYADASEFGQALLDYMYPQAPPAIQRSLSAFMKETFAEERAAERERLARGSRIAEELHKAEPDLSLSPEWEESPGSGATIQQEPQEPNRAPLVVAIAVVLALLGVVGVLLSRDKPPAEVVEREVQVLPTEGALQLRLNVPAKVYAGTELLAQGSLVELNHLEPGEMALRIEAEGYLPSEEVLGIVAGERVVMSLRLEPVPVEEEEQTPERRPPASEPPAVEILDPIEVKEPDPEPIGRPPVAVEFGKVSINISGGKGWGDVFVDGKNIGRTPKFNHELKAGQHTVRVVNEQLDLDYTKKVTIVGGETAKVLAPLR
ncbi:MAG: serine/threonine protein kinase [Cognaticolwellia sp.]